jgi:hypothetical protein
MSLIKWSIRERDGITAANTLTGELRGSAGQLIQAERIAREAKAEPDGGEG